MGADFMGYWSVGYIANHWTFSKIYDFALLEKIQQTVVFGHYYPEVYFPPLPVAYPPIFIRVFQVLALLPPAISFLTWVLANFLLGVGYLFFFSKSFSHTEHRRTILLLIISFPFFMTLFEGQVNILLLVFVGEFTRALSEKKPFRAGLWISALLLKPQTLIVILPLLFISKQWKTLFGAAAGATFIILTSVWTAGKNGIETLVQLWTGYAGNLATSGVSSMGNWRMIGTYLSPLCPDSWIKSIVLFASILTILWALYLWATHPNAPLDMRLTLAFSATLLATWHSHSHMAAILIPLLLLLSINKKISSSILSLWTFLPPALYLFWLIALLFIQDRNAQGLLYAPAQFALNLFLLIWTSRELLHPRKSHDPMD
jgi:hypothetical protein